MKYLLLTLVIFAPCAKIYAQSENHEVQTSQVSTNSKMWIEAESNLVKQSFNEARIPADNGTTFSIVDFNEKFNFAYRIYAGYIIDDKHEIRALYAPLQLAGSKIISQDIYYKEKTFVKGSELTAKYKFNSYRLTYRYTLLSENNYKLKLGLTGKIRDAAIELSIKNAQNFTASRVNLGFVPLLHANFSYKLPNSINFLQNLYFLSDIDALASPQGRAEDVSLLLALEINNNLTIKTGYRTVEGGAKNGGNVYTFAWLNYAVFSILNSFN